jgi:hypothetical protein
MTAGEAVTRVLANGCVRMTVGEGGPEDPVLLVWREDSVIMSAAVAGWSAGVVEPVCAVGSDFLRTYFDDRHALERAERPT